MYRACLSRTRCAIHGEDEICELLSPYGNLVDGKKYCWRCLQVEANCLFCGEICSQGTSLSMEDGVWKILQRCVKCEEAEDDLDEEHCRTSEHNKMQENCWCVKTLLLPLVDGRSVREIL